MIPQPCHYCNMLVSRDRNGRAVATHPAVAEPWTCPANPSGHLIAAGPTGPVVKVYIYDAEYECPYSYEWMDRPYSPVGDMLRYSEEHSHMIPAEQYERWKAAREADFLIQQEIAEILGAAAKRRRD